MIFVLLMMIQEGAVAVHNDSSHSLQMLDEGSWKLLHEMFLNSQDICSKSRETYSWALMRYFDWLKGNRTRSEGADTCRYRRL